MVKAAILNIALFVCLSVVLFNIAGCATHSVWEKRPLNKVTVTNETKADAYGFYSGCSEAGNTSGDEIVVPFKAAEDNGQFPPFKEGFLVISSDEGADYIIEGINQRQMERDDDLLIAYIKAKYLQTVDPDKKQKYWSDYLLGVRDLCGGVICYGRGKPGPGSRYADDIKIRFIQKTGNITSGLGFESLTKRPVCFEVTFAEGTLKFSEYKKGFGTRVALTPLSVIIDVITAPFQLVAILTCPLWCPR